MVNQVFDAVKTVMAVRGFTERQVPDDVSVRIVEAARLTASAMNRQSWHFVVVRDRENLRQLGSLVKTGPYTAGAAFAVVVAHPKGNPYAMSDATRAIQSMILTAWADGVGSNWTGFGGLDGVRKKVGLPDTFDVLAVVPFGYPARPVKGVKKRKPLEQVASAERYGDRFP